MADLYSRISFLLVIYLDVCKFQSLNLALKKPAWMSSFNLLHQVAANAVDGSHGTNMDNGVCSHTNFGDMSPWFVVDLLGQHSVHNVTIYNRGDCCGERLHDFVIQVYVQNPSRCLSAAFSICKNYTGTFGSVGNIACDAPVLGRFIRLWKPKIRNGEDVLNFCELEVYGVQSACLQFNYFRRSGIRLVSPVIVSSPDMSPLSCVLQCMLSGACVGVNYNRGTRECELLPRPQPTDTVSSDLGWVYYGDDLC
ncbi:pentraxin fusion protein-like [Haliotis cracherodii]|uniref:pentraxin fusion protein-like n=1 Tax=Haliotis cracherodii TaxID=6455 RepID=UPI0039EC79CA